MTQVYEWEPGTPYGAGAIVRYQGMFSFVPSIIHELDSTQPCAGVLYKIIQPHTSEVTFPHSLLSKLGTEGDLILRSRAGSHPTPLLSGVAWRSLLAITSNSSNRAVATTRATSSPRKLSSRSSRSTSHRLRRKV